MDRLERDAYDDSYQSYKLVADLIGEVGDPIIVVFGVFGNVMIILTMLRLPPSTFSVFFIVLAASDMWMMATPLQNFLWFMFSFTFVKNQGTWQCKIYRFMIRLASPLSSWMLVSLTMLRAASVLWPLRVIAVWTKRKSLAAVGVVTSILTLINAHYLYGFIFYRELCYVLRSGLYGWYIFTIESWVRLLQVCFTPLVILIVSNGVLLWTLYKTVRINNHLSSQQSTQNSRQQKVSSLTITLIAANISFFLLTTPIAICIIIERYVDDDDPVQKGQLKVFYIASEVLWTFNSAVNFYMYCLTGSKFRAEFLNIAGEFRGIFFKANR